MFTFQTKKSMLKALLTKNSPFYIQFYVSKYCHLKCKMCNIVEANSDLTPFSENHIEQIAKNLVSIGAGVVLLTGGEPFMRPDIDKIVKIFKEHKLDVRLQTAGLMQKKHLIKNCVDFGARDINVSLDSLDSQLNDYINGIEGSWEKAIETVSFISQTFPQKESICAFGCVLSNYNLHEIDSILDFASEIGWWLSLVPVHIANTEDPRNFQGYDPYFKIPKEKFPYLKDLIQRLKRRKRSGANLFDSDDYLDSIYHFITTGKPNWRKNNLCDSPNLYFAILPDGRFAPCCDFRHSEDIYVFDQEFPEIFKSKIFRQNVRKITSQCSGCNYGSYPEMSLFARHFSTQMERVALQLKTKKNGIKPISIESLHNIINLIKQKNNLPPFEKDTFIREEKHWPQASNIPERLWNS